MTQVSRDQRDIEKPSTQASSYKIDAETPTTQAPSDKIDAETPTTQAPSDKIDAETPTSPTHPRLTRIDQRKRGTPGVIVLLRFTEISREPRHDRDMFSIRKGVSILAFFLIVQTVVKGECENVPQVPESSNNATQHRSFADGSAIEFTCNPGYKGVGSTYYYCHGSEWTGNFSCLRDCPEIKTPRNGRIVRRTVYGVTTELEFACRDGYTLVGSPSMLCGADRNWRPEAPPTCDPVSCQAFGSVPNGEVLRNNSDDVLNHFGSEIRISCNKGYNLIGSPTVTCKSDGIWRTRPQCKVSSCGTHPSLKSKCIRDIATTKDGFILSLLCRDKSANVSVTVVGSGTAFCENNKWDNQDIGCFCDCWVDIDSKEGLSYNNLFNKKFVKHGKPLNWDCKEGYQKQGSTNISCYDGLMEKPHCVRKKELNEQKEIGTGITVAVVMSIVFLIIIVVIIFKRRYFDKEKGRAKEADEEGPVIERCTATTKNAFEKQSNNCEEINSSNIELATAPLVQWSSRDQTDTKIIISQSLRDQ